MSPLGRPARLTAGVLCAVLLSCDATSTVSFFPPEGAAGSGDAGAPREPVEGSGGTVASGGASPIDVPSPAVLLHRYDFSGTDATVPDLVGDAPGIVMGGALLAGDGILSLDGDDDYVSFPGGLLSPLGSVSIVTWFTWKGGVPWERVFDFGATAEGGGVPGTATSTLFFTPLYISGPGSSAHFEVSDNKNSGSSSMIAANSEAAFPTGLMHQIVVVFDGSTRTLLSYIDGTLQAETTGSIQLSELRDENGWLGQSMWEQDGHTHGTYDEFRIYHGVLRLEDITALLTAGPDRP